MDHHRHRGVVTGMVRGHWAPAIAAVALLVGCAGGSDDSAVTTVSEPATVVSSTTASTTTTVAATSTTQPPPPFTRVVFLGDSLAEETEPLLLPLLQSVLGTFEFVGFTLGSTAPCDWFTNDLQPSPTTLIVMSFHGNSLTSCMKDAAGNFLSKGAIVEKYANDLGYLLDRVTAAGAQVLLVGQPVDRMLDDGTYGIIPALNDLYQRLADERGLRYVDAGAAVEAPDGSFALQLPCTSDDLQCGADGTNVVRTEDGVHFCPGARPMLPCRSYPAGAYRFALAISRAVEAW